MSDETPVTAEPLWIEAADANTTVLSGDAALDVLITAIADFDQERGKQPTKIQMSYAFGLSLVRLGANYHGYETAGLLWRYGPSAFERSTLFGMDVEVLLRPGIGFSLA